MIDKKMGAEATRIIISLMIDTNENKKANIIKHLLNSFILLLKIIFLKIKIFSKNIIEKNIVILTLYKMPLLFLKKRVNIQVTSANIPIIPSDISF